MVVASPLSSSTRGRRFAPESLVLPLLGRDPDKVSQPGFGCWAAEAWVDVEAVAGERVEAPP
jgi:hypothetical protein